MSKERLEEAKKLIKHYHEQKLSNNVMLTERGVELIEHLYEQAERVQELENRIADDVHFVAEILEQNKRYRETIEEAIEYANSPKILTSPAGIEKILSKVLDGEE